MKYILTAEIETDTNDEALELAKRLDVDFAPLSRSYDRGLRSFLLERREPTETGRTWTIAGEWTHPYPEVDFDRVHETAHRDQVADIKARVSGLLSKESA